TWIIKILINECNIIYNDNSKQLDIAKKIAKNKEYKFFENTTSKVDSKLDFESLLSTLSYDEKIIVVLYYNNKYTTSEIADILGENVNTIKIVNRYVKLSRKIAGIKITNL
uniref:sigma factor-like helix-turn-helix DNA-binding protein n=1 Tax=Parabacteroides goldsteinii TaxID=328812 RepID=UPI00260BE6A3